MIPRTMSTQHPDNVYIPFFAQEPQLSGEDEIIEAFYAFSVLGVEEQMWDFEGKEVDEFVVKKLLEKYPHFFRKHRLGRDFRITPRVPNPSVEKAEAKLLLETLESIPRSADYARLFYGEKVAPIFEVILPMTTFSEEIERVYELYRRYIIGKQYKRVYDVKIYEWIGEFFPEEINVIPLFETKEAILNSHEILEEYLTGKNFEYQRVFLARSDPAMNYGLISAVMYDKYALFKLQELEEELSIPLYPIIGVGGAPFRGHFTPKNVDAVMEEYPSAQTFTVQSSFKYDNEPKEVIKAIEKVNDTKRKETQAIDEKIFEILDKYEEEYTKELKILAPYIREVAKAVPSRRKRKLHIGLFGYSREVNGEALPRAIKFTASLYSLGIPPEILGLRALSEGELERISEHYRGLYNDISFALRFFNPKAASRFKFLGDIAKMQKEMGVEKDERHLSITTQILNGKIEESLVVEAASIRGFLG
ncbi:Phosphoenolpyruvate carboxylase, archaeal [Thermococcus sp. 2319x1]|uniref:phosphoenolpyruvate carboxylase n=1 Tax=Thermococcus sp. 2319x1 TaxID=1674923 RepID=UPI00073AA9E4|nr:phosphoenolpyruvate carboxylase [Thermococcus sp. 2319x1]ALV62475.1 Phosphoenolpyruvate carboxylase, archaeal [Thermococcus sp. 2319x1]